jgi:hypothetical protein
MKKIINIAVLISTTIIISGGCTKNVSKLPQNAATVGTFFKSSKDITSALSGMYGTFLQSMIGTGGTSGGGSANYFLWGEVRSDNFVQTGYSQTQSVSENVSNSIASDNVSSDWGILYQTIARANLNIANIPKVAQYDNSVTPTITNNALAQCYAMRAECYFYIVRNWGGGPIWTQAYLDPTQPGASKARASAQTVIDSLIIPDLTKAYSLIQKGQQPTVWYINEGAICAIMADVYMWRASAPVPPSPGAPVGGPIGGTADYQNAITWIKNLFAARAPSNGAPLYAGISAANLESTATWKNVFLNPASSVEGIWSLNWDETLNGCACIPISIQTSNNPYRVDGGNATNPVNGGIYTTWPKNTADIRVKQTFDPTVSGAAAGESTLKYYNAATQAALTGTTGGAISYNVYLVMYRLSDVYLSYAEALNQTGNLAGALTYLNYIHTRAGLPAVLPTAVSTTATMQAAILQERQWELFGEGKRWFDLVRTNTAASVMSPILVGRKYPPFTDINRVLWPLSITALNANSSLVQNNNLF